VLASAPPRRLEPIGVRWVGAMVAVVVSLVMLAPGSAGADQPSYPPIGSVVISHSLPGFTRSAEGPTNGPLSATSFAAQSADPTQAEEEFHQLAVEPGFAAYVRLWTDLHGPGGGANDVGVTLFRIPNLTSAADFEAGTRQPAMQNSSATTFIVPSIPGAVGSTVEVGAPSPAQEQVVVFRSGIYVAIVQLASSNEHANPATLTSADAIDIAYRQYLATRQAAASVSTPRSSSTLLVVALAVVVLALAAAGFEVARRRRRGSATPAVTDPWGDDGPLAAMGARVPGPHSSTDSAGSEPGLAPPVAVPGGAGPLPVPEVPGAATPPTAAGPVPATPLAPVPSGGPTTPVGRLDEPAAGTEPAWLPDPTGAPGTLRYWDGLAWTSHVAVRSTFR